jgi:hypothetical protein
MLARKLTDIVVNDRGAIREELTGLERPGQ